MPFKQQTLRVIQSRVDSMLTDSCTIERESGGVGLMGEPVCGWTVIAQNVPCRVISAGRGSRSAYEEVGSQEALVQRYRLMCEKGTAFTVNDRVTVNGNVYQIVDVMDGWTDSVMVGAVMVGVRDE